jgi:hypothetical protein
MDTGAPDGRVPRAVIARPCTLRRRSGAPIPGQTIDVGPDGMRVMTTRPLAEDETVAFDLPGLDMRLAGQARVQRQQRLNVSALRCEGLPEPMVRRLHALAINAR